MYIICLRAEVRRFAQDGNMEKAEARGLNLVCRFQVARLMLSGGEGGGLKTSWAFCDIDFSPTDQNSKLSP